MPTGSSRLQRRLQKQIKILLLFVEFSQDHKLRHVLSTPLAAELPRKIYFLLPNFQRLSSCITPVFTGLRGLMMAVIKVLPANKRKGSKND